MKIFLDDFRDPKDCIVYMHQRIGDKNLVYLEDWTIVRNYEQFIDAIAGNIDIITHVSFDHDLADEHYVSDANFSSWEEYHSQENRELTGLDCARWMKKLYETQGKNLPTIFVHSMNPVGTNNILNEFKSK